LLRDFERLLGHSGLSFDFGSGIAVAAQLWKPSFGLRGETVSHLLVVFGRATRARSRFGAHAIARYVVVLVFAVATLSLLGGSAAHAAGGGYGPGIAGPAGAPGGFSNIVTTHAFSTTGGTVSANVPGGEAELTVPDGAFSQPIQAIITAPDLAGINAVLPQLGFGGYSAIGGVGISIDDANGKPITGLFVHPLTLTITGPGIGTGNLLVEFTSLSTAATLQDAVFTAGSVTVSLAADPDFAVLAPTPAGSSTAASASANPSTSSSSPPTAVLGEQFTKGGGSSIVGRIVFSVLVVLVIATAGMMLALRRRRPDSFVPRHSSAGTHAKQRRAPAPTFAPKHARS
jgi:hypothetical protein